MPRSSRQRQSRLTFTPLPSSSPAAKGYNKQIQDRAAAVTLTSSPHSKRQSNGLNHAMPTPASQHGLQVKSANDDSESDSEPIQHSQRRHNTARQQRIDFSNARDPSSFSPLIKLTSSATAKPQSSDSTRAGMFSGARRRKLIDISSDEDFDDDLPTFRKLVAQSKPSSRQGSGRITRSRALPEESGEEATITVRRPSSPIKIDSDQEDDDDDMPTTAGTQRRKRAAPASRASPDSFIASSPPQMNEESDDDLEIIRPPAKRRRLKPRGDESEDDEESPRTPARRSLKTQRKLSQREKDELDEELDFLGPSSDVEMSAKKSRDSYNTHKSAKAKALEALKRKRSRQVAKREEPTTIENSDAEELGEEDEESDEVEDMVELVQASRSSQMFQEDENDAGFIESDDADNTLGIPDGLPLEFTRYASMKAKELFKFAVEWFVQKKMNPGFQMNDPIYELTFRKLDDEVTGLAASKFKSSVWVDEFVYTLNARPQIAHDTIDRSEAEHFMRDTCDACNRTGHPATYQVQFHGNPYHRQTLEDVGGNDDDEDDDESSSESENSNEPTYDADGRQIAPQTKSWYVGKFCFGNAKTAHALQHWRYHLNEWVLTWLAKNGYDRAEEVVKRDAMSTKKRRKYANRIVDELEEKGVVKQLYRDYKQNIDEARNSKQGRYTAWK